MVLYIIILLSGRNIEKHQRRGRKAQEKHKKSTREGEEKHKKSTRKAQEKHKKSTRKARDAVANLAQYRIVPALFPR